MADQKKRPVATVSDGYIQIAIWRNEGTKGDFFNATVQNAYRDERGDVRSVNNFSGTELLKLSEVARDAYRETNRLTREYHRGRNQQQNDRQENSRPDQRPDTPEFEMGGAYDRDAAAYDNGHDSAAEREQRRTNDQRRPNPR